jgi:hypothetical protein
VSAALAMPLVLRSAQAVAQPSLPVNRTRTIEGYAFYRRHTIALLNRFLRISMELGRSPSLLGNVVFRGRVSSYRLSTFEDLVLFVIDVEKCLRQLDRTSQAVIAHMVFEDYTALETATMLGESLRSVLRRHGEALDHLTRLFLDSGLMEPQKAEQPKRISPAPVEEDPPDAANPQPS